MKNVYAIGRDFRSAVLHPEERIELLSSFNPVGCHNNAMHRHL
jgi:hypothetical protein